MTTLIALLLSVGAFAQPASAQAPSPPPASRPIRVVLVGAKLPTVVNAPLYFKLLSAKIPAGQTASHAGANGMLYLLSGSLAVTADGAGRSLREGEGLFVLAGKRAMLKVAGKDPAVFLLYLLLPAAELNKPMVSEPATVTELYRTVDPIPGLQPGPYAFTLTRATLLPQTPRPPMHHRSGAALYYVLSGSGDITLKDRIEPRPQGTVQYEPHELVHSWSNIGTTPLVLLQANISQEGIPEVIFLR